MFSTDDLVPFERVPGEPARAYHAFAHYRDGGPQRSLDRAWRQHHADCLHQVQPETRRRPMSWGNWSARWGWVERAAAYDAHHERQKQAALEAEQIEAAKRHARVLQAAISTLTLPIRVALEVGATPAGMERLRLVAQTGYGLRAALAEARLAAALLPQLVQAERLVLGMTTDVSEVREPPVVDPIATAIVRDPALTRMASDLLHEIAMATVPAGGKLDDVPA